MSYKHLLMRLSLIIIVSLTTNLSAQTKVLVTATDGSETAYSVDENGKLFFSETDLMIQETNGEIFSIALSNIRKINFESEGQNNEEISTSEITAVFPNPSGDYIKIAHSDKSDFDVVVYSLQGNVVLKGHYTNDDSIDISSLPAGLYLIRIDEKVVKFCKL